MKIVCFKCKTEMDFPYMKCNDCGWEPDSKKKEMGEKFARKYIKKNGNDPELTIILENAIKSGNEVEEDWKAGVDPGKDLKVKCHRCNKEIIFPFLECTECGWVARREWRKRAKVLSEMYIEQNEEKEESLRIIWDEENHRLKRK